MRTTQLGFLVLVLPLALLLAACVPKHRVMVTGRGIAIGAPLSTVADGPFRLLFGGPKGPSTASTKDREVTLAFSRSVPTIEPPASVVRDDDGRAVDGTWQWFGESAAVFHPDKPFALATTYRVEPRLLTAHDGAKLAGESIAPFTFTTDRPTLERVSYEYDEKKNEHLVHVSFDQAITTRSAREALRIEGAAGKRVAFRLIDESPASSFTLHADASIGRLENVTVIATTAIRGTEGPLGPTAEAHLPLEGVGPFKVKLSCREPDAPARPESRSAAAPRCDSTEPIHLELTRDVLENDLLRRLVIAAPAKAAPEELKAISERNPSQTTSFDLGALLSVEPGKKYRVTLKAGLIASDKERLASDQMIEFETLDLPASLAWRDLTSPVMVVESARKFLPISVVSTNVPSFDVVSAPLDEPGLARFLAAKTSGEAMVRDLPRSTAATLTVTSTRNESTQTSVNIAENRAPGASGAWVVASRAPGLEDDVRLLSITDLGVHVKWSPHGALVWVTRLSSAEPVAGATISLRRLAASAMVEAFSAITDREGIATIPGDVAATFLREQGDDSERAGLAQPGAPETDAPAPVLFVKHDADWTFMRLPELDPSLMSAIGDVFVDRGLYRPGETILTKGYFRMPGPRGLLTLAGKTVYLEALDAADHVFSAQTTTLDAFGAFTAEVLVPKTARLGRSSLRARIGSRAPTPRSGRARRWWGVDHVWPARDRFSIDSFRTPEFKVEAKVDRESAVRGESVTLTATGSYLLGAPMTNVPVNVAVSRWRTTFVPRGLEAFSVSDAFFGESPPESDIPKSKLQGKLDSAGYATFTYPLSPTKTASRPESYRFDVDIDDVSRAFAMSDAATVLVHPSDVYLGIKADAGAPPLIPGKSVRADVVSASVDGVRRGGLAVKIELFRATEKSAPPVATGRSCIVTTHGDKLASCDLTVTTEGKHWLKATAVDASGRALVAASAFHVEAKNTKPPPPPPPAVPSGPSLTFEEQCRRPSTADWRRGLTLESHDAPYRLGDHALACVRSMVESRSKNARGLFTVEREGILRREPILDLGASESRLLKIPMTEDIYPSAHVTLAEVAGRAAPFPSPGHSDGGHPSFSSGSQEVAVSVPAKKLEVAIDTAKEARPGSEIELRVTVKDGDGRPTAAQVTLWAVDEGIHLLMPKSLPTPESTFGVPRDTDVVESDTRKGIFFEHGSSRYAKAPSLRQGATSISDRSLVGRSVFRPTAFFFTNIITGANGAATVRAKLPDNLTTWKVFAVAATTADAFGGGETSFATNKPLMLRPQLPRFVRAGDSFDGTVMVDSLVKDPIEIAFSFHTSGALAGSRRDPGAPMKVAIPALGHVPVRVPLEARSVGAGKIVFETTSTKGATFRDEVTVGLEVASSASLESVVVTGEIPQSSSPTIIHEALGDLSKVRAETGGFEYRFSTTPLVGLAASLNDLVEYPHGCTEQLTSRLVPLIRLREMAKDLGVALPANVDAAVRSSLASLLTHQQPDGGFGFWRESKQSEPWLTVLAVGALQTAQQHGYVVPASSVDAGQKYLEDGETNPLPAKKRAPLDPAARAMREDLLASLGKPRPAELRALAADPTLPLFARALVVHALASFDRALARSLLDRIVAGAQQSAAVVTFVDEPSLVQRAHLSSNARTTAMVLRALLAIDPRDPLVTKMVRGLLSLRRDGRWQTTQDSAWALTALEDARALYRPPPGQTSAELLFDRHVVAKTEFTGAPGGETRTGTIAMSRLLGAPGASVGFESDGKRSLYYEGTLRYARRDPPTSPLDHGVTVARSLRPLKAGSTELHVGDYAVAELMIVTSMPRDLVVLDDPIPAGFEAVNGAFASMEQAAPLVVDPAVTLTHRELHDDRVVSFFDALPAGVTRTRYVLRTIAAGHFAHPPARAECMYAPDVFGRTAASWVDTR